MSADTRHRLLTAAIELFAERGFQATTIQEIAKRAGANIAAVHYHFGDKASFFGALLEHAIEQMPGGPPPPPSEATEDPEEQLRGFVRRFLQRVRGQGPAALLKQIQLQEMSRGGEASPVLDMVVEKLVRPEFGRLRQIVSALLPPDAPAEMIRRYAFSVVSQCGFYMHAAPIIQRLMPDFELDAEEAGRIADHVAELCLAGMRAERARAVASDGLQEESA